MLNGVHRDNQQRDNLFLFWSQERHETDYKWEQVAFMSGVVVSSITIEP